MHGCRLEEVPTYARRKRVDVGEVKGAEPEDADIEMLRIDAAREALRGLATAQDQIDVVDELARGSANMPAGRRREIGPAIAIHVAGDRHVLRRVLHELE